MTSALRRLGGRRIDLTGGPRRTDQADGELRLEAGLDQGPAVTPPSCCYGDERADRCG